MPLAADSGRKGRRWGGNCARVAVDRGIAVAWSAPGVIHAGANAQGTDCGTRFTINLYLCFSVIKNLAPATAPGPFAADCGNPEFARWTGNRRSVTGNSVLDVAARRRTLRVR
jgi:hypothetical protein